MAGTDLALATTLKATSGYSGGQGQSGEALTAGNVIYKNADTKLYKALATSALACKAVGIVLVSAPGIDQPVNYIVDGDLTNLTGLADGEMYFVSETTGGSIMKYSDIGAGEYASFVGQATSTTTFHVHLYTAARVHA